MYSHSQVFLATGNSLTAFYFTFKAVFVLKIFEFLPWLFLLSRKIACSKKNGLRSKLRLISKFMTPQTGKPTIIIYVLPNISRSKDNQTMKFGQFIEYNMRNIFLEKSCTKGYGENSTRPFSKKSKLSISWDQQSEYLYSSFLVHSQFEDCQSISKPRCWPLAFYSFKTF